MNAPDYKSHDTDHSASGSPDWRPSAEPGWRGNGMVATMNGTGFMFEVRDRLADDFIALAGKVRRPVLEIGCAYGVATIPALEAGGVVTACDMEPQHLAVLRSKVAEELLPQLTLVTGQLPAVDFAEQRFAAILCSRVLHFLTGDEIDASLRKMARWLEPGGRLFLVADTPYGVWRRAIAQFEAGKRAGARWPGMIHGLHNYLSSPGPEPIEKPPFLNLLDPDLMARSCREAGLTIIEAAFIPRPDFGELGRLDGRESAGVVALRPPEA